MKYSKSPNGRAEVSYLYEYSDKPGEYRELTFEYEVSAYDPGCASGPEEYLRPPEGGEAELIEITDDAGAKIEVKESQKLVEGKPPYRSETVMTITWPGLPNVPPLELDEKAIASLEEDAQMKVSEYEPDYREHDE